jgi:hypothetical protein
MSVEALCISYRKLAGGGRAVSFRIHSDDAYLVEHLEPNRRYALDVAEIGDDEKQVKQPQEALTQELHNNPNDRSTPGPRGRGSQNKYLWRAIKLSKNPLFQQFVLLQEKPNEDAADYIRRKCHVTSRKDIKPNTEAGLALDLIESVFDLWQNGPKYVEETS